jgi:hypothetical protein
MEMLDQNWEFAVVATDPKEPDTPLAVLMTNDIKVAQAFFLKHDGNATFYKGVHPSEN